MLFRLFSESAEKYYRCWDRCVKTCWSVPLSTHKVFVKFLLSEEFSSVRVNILSRYTNFFQSLLHHKSPEVVKVANISGKGIESTTGQNLAGIYRETGLNPWCASPSMVKSYYNSVTCNEEDLWRIELLRKYLSTRLEMENNLEETKEITALIDSLCSS